MADTGWGIPEAEISRINEPFYMVDKSRSKKMGGSGLGLALVQKIAEAHGDENSDRKQAREGHERESHFPDNKTFTK